jgi:SET domain-containing protein
MNHDCERNTSVRSGNGVQVYVFAARDIEAGEEITTSYQHSGPEVKYKSRQRALLQYLFECRCEMCSVQKLEYLQRRDNGDDSSDEDDY